MKKLSGMNLYYSPDENIWYFERFSDWKQSQSFDTKLEALEAKRNNQLIWSH